MTITIIWYDPKTRQKQDKAFEDEMRADMFKHKLMKEGKRVLAMRRDAKAKEKADEPKDE